MGQRAVEASFEYHVNDEMTFSFRALAFAGEPDTPLGDFASRDFAGVAFRWLY